MDDHEPNIRSRELGLALRQAMEGRGLTGQRMADLLGWSQARVSRLLNGRRGVRPADVASFLAHCHVTGPERDRLVALAEDQGKEDWLQQYGSRLPTQLRTYIDHENRATIIRDYQALAIPGLLQTEGYARAIISCIASVPAEEVEDRVHARVVRQQLFSSPERPRFEFYLDEFVLWRPVGGRGVMSEQLHHLLRMSVRKDISIRAVPRGVGAHAGLAGSFILLSSDSFMPVVYLEGETSGIFLEKPATTNAYRDVLNALADVALDEEQSRELIGSVAVDQYASPEEHDDHE
jgi:transcriptional regulator with XRE-family HTH domain